MPNVKVDVSTGGAVWQPCTKRWDPVDFSEAEKDLACTVPVLGDVIQLSTRKASVGACFQLTVCSVVIY